MLPDSILPASWPIKIHMYGVMIAVGLLLGFGVLFLYCKKKKVNEKFVDFIFYNGIAAIVLGFLSGSLFQATYNFIEDPSAGFKLGSGMTFIGGLIGGIAVFLIGYFIFRKRFDTRLYEVVSVIPCVILIAHGFGRIGCFFAGCCYGKPTDSFLGVTFPGHTHPVHPTQLYEAAFLFILFGICFWLVMKKDFKHNLSVYLICYGIFRFLIEYLRGDDRGELVGPVSPSQFWSLFMIVGGVAVYFFMRYILKKEGAKKASLAESGESEAQEPSEATEEDAK